MKKYSLLLLLLLVASLNANVILQHSQPVNANQDRSTDLTLQLTGEKITINEATLFYRAIGELTYKEIVMHPSEITSDLITFTLPAAKPPITGYEYYFQLKSNQGAKSLPENLHNPFKLLVGASALPSSLNFILLNDDLEVRPNQDLVFAASFYGLENELDTNSIRLFVNGRDVTKGAKISAPLVVYTIKEPTNGVYDFQVKANLKSGKSVSSKNWGYKVAGKPSFFDSLPLNLRGDALFTSNVRDKSTDDESIVSDLNDASFRMNLYANKKWFAFRGRLYLSSYESSSKQSINRYTLGFTLPFLDLDLIDSSPDYGTFLLSNRNIRGVSGRLHFGSLSILATKGESVRSVDGITADDGSVTSGGTFKRNTLGGKIELGTLDGLQLGFGFAKNKDDIESLEESFYKRDDGTVIATPKDNIVLGATARLGLDNQRLVLGAEAAVSIYNSNIIDGPLSKEELEDYIEDELPLDPDALKDIIIINTNIEPLIPNVANVAYQVYMRWFLLGNYLSASYSEIGASFNSLSASFLQNDSKVITLSDNISLFNNQFVLDGGVNIISDNLSEQKETTNTNTNWYAQALIRPRGLPYLKVGYNLNKSEDDLEVKEIEQQMDAMNFGVGYNIYQLPFTTTSIDLSTYFANDKDLTDNSSFDFKRNNYQVVIQNKLKEIPLSTRLTLGNTVRTNNFDEEKNTYFQWGLKNEYALWNGMLKPYLDLRFNTYEEDKYSTYELGTQYQPFVRTTINTSVEFSNNNFDQDDRENYSTFNWRLSIAQRF